MKNPTNLRLMYAISLLQGMVFYGPIATLYRQAAGVTIFQITVIESVSLALCLLLELPWGIVADKIGYKKTMIFCCLLYMVTKVIFWRAGGFFGFLLERVLLSVVIAGMSGVDTSILFLSCEPGKSQKVFAVYNNLGTAGLLLAALSYSVFVKSDYRLAGLLTVFSYGAAAVLSFFLHEVRRSAAEEPFGAKDFFSVFRQVVKNRRLLLFLVGAALLNETHQTITVFLNQLQYVKCGLSNEIIGVVYIAVTVIGLLGVASARLTNRFGTKASAVTLYLAAASACVVLAVTNLAWASVFSVLLLRVSFSLYQPLLMRLQNEQIFTANRATALSIHAVLMDSVGIAANLAFGKSAEWSLPSAMLLGAFFCLSGLLLFLFWHRKYPAPRQGGGNPVSAPEDSGPQNEGSKVF